MNSLGYFFSRQRSFPFQSKGKVPKGHISNSDSGDECLLEQGPVTKSVLMRHAITSVSISETHCKCPSKCYRVDAMADVSVYNHNNVCAPVQMYIRNQMLNISSASAQYTKVLFCVYYQLVSK